MSNQNADLEFRSNELRRYRWATYACLAVYVIWGMLTPYTAPQLKDPMWIRYLFAAITFAITLYSYRSKYPLGTLNFALSFAGFALTLQSMYLIEINDMNMMNIVSYFIFFAAYLTFIQSRRILFLYLTFCFLLNLAIGFALPEGGQTGFMLLTVGHLAIAFTGGFSKALQFKTVEKLALSEAQKSLVFSNIMDGIVMHDNQGNVVYSNPAAAQILSDGREIEGKNIFQSGWKFTDEKGQPIIESELPLAVSLKEKKTVKGFVMGFARAKNTAMNENSWLSVNTIPIFAPSVVNKKADEHKLIGVLSTFQDITDLKKSHDLNIQQSAKLVEASKLRTLGEMAGGVAHEINTPLAVIQMRTEVVMDEIESENMNKDKIKDSLKAVDQTVKRIAKIVNGLRFFSRDGSKEPMMEYSTVQIIEDTFGLCRERFVSNGVKLEFSNDRKDYKVHCRPEQISQVLLNMLNNSFDAIENLSEKWVKVSLSETPQAVVFRVTDSGKGISTEVQEKMLLPFFTTKELGKGTGLGLSISRGIVESHGGKIEIDNSSPNTCILFNIKKQAAS